LYSRFWHKVLFDRGHVSGDEPFQRLVNQGMILGEAELTGYKKSDGSWISVRQVSEATDPETGETYDVDATIAAESGRLMPVKLTQDQVTKKGSDFVLTDNPAIAVDSRAFKMSKSRGNVINPDKVVDEYGADALRLYEMFMGPLEAA